MNRHIPIYAVLASALLFLLGLWGCSKHSLEFHGKNQLAVETSAYQLDPHNLGGITIPIKRTRGDLGQQSVAVRVVEGDGSLLELPTAVTFEGQALQTELVVRPKRDIIVVKALSITLSIGPLPDMEEELSLVITLLPTATSLKDLTPEQQALVAHWLKQGYPLDRWLGRDLEVTTTVAWPVDGYLAPFNERSQKTYTSTTQLTLDSSCSKDHLVLAFPKNALGLEAFFLFALRIQTIENDEFWFSPNAGPLFREVCELIKWNRNSPETFSCRLYNLRVAPKDSQGLSTVETMSETTETQYGDKKFHTHFKFSYSAWDRLKALIDQGNKKAIECHTCNASPYPYYYLNDVDFHHQHTPGGPYVSEYDGETPFTPQLVTIDWNKGRMDFKIQTGIEVGGGYFDVTGSITLPAQ